jgi:hypothetical protein
VLLACSLLLSCGSDEAPPSTSPTGSSLAALCATPRSGIDPTTRGPYRDRPGTLADEKQWVRSWIDQLYLWYREVPIVDPAAYATPQEYFAVLKTPATTPSGRDKDRFHFFAPTEAVQAQLESGVEVGYGIRWDVVASTPPREVRVAYVEPGLPAANAGASLRRGAVVLRVDGVDLVDGSDVSALNAGLFPASPGETHTLDVRDFGSETSRPVTLTSAEVTTDPVQKMLLAGGIGYVQFNDHVATAEAQLISAIEELAAARSTDLVLDIRYNGGGFLDIASEVAFMIAGPDVTAGKTFERIVFNDRYPNLDPVTGNLVSIPFHQISPGFSALAGRALPHLDLPRVFVITGAGTCSASESIINGLQGAGLEVIQVGGTTCGKPYGFYPQDNCGTTYFAIQFQGLNAEGFGAYDDGFTPGGTGDASPPGCLVPDDYAHELGDPAEGRLAAALAYAASGTCPQATIARALTRSAPSSVLPSAVPGDEGEAVAIPPLRESRILRR